MSKGYKISGSMLLEPVFQEKVRRQDFTNIVLKGDRYLSFLKDIDKLSTKDIREISSKKYQLPKLQTVISCGNGRVLPEIIEMFYPSESNTDHHKEPGMRESRKFQLPEISSNKKIKDILLTECAKKDSFFEFKKNKKRIMVERKDSRKRIRTLPNSPPQQLRTLKMKHLSCLRNSMDHRVNEKEITPFETVQSQPDEENSEKEYTSVPARGKHFIPYEQILENYESASEYNFPPLKLFKVLKCLDKSSKLVEKQMEQQVIREQKVNFDKKFDRLLENQQITYKQHLAQYKEHKKARRRLN